MGADTSSTVDVYRVSGSSGTATAWRDVVRPAVCWAPAGLVGAYAVIRGLAPGAVFMLTAFTPYAAAASVLVVLVTVACRHWVTAGIAALACALLVTLVAPRALGGPDPGTGPRLRVMSLSLDGGNGDAGTVVDLVRSRQIDVLTLDEYTPDAQDRLFAAGLDRALPYDWARPQPGPYGSAIFSRYPLNGFAMSALPGGYLEVNAYLHVPGAQELSVYAVHVPPPTGLSGGQAWRDGLAAQPAANPGGPVRLLLGDFDATLDQPQLRALLDTGYRDVADELGAGLVPTFPWDVRLRPPPITIDHLLTDPRVGAVSFGAGAVPGCAHRPVYATLTVPAG